MHKDVEALFPDPDRRDAGLERLLARVTAGRRYANGAGNHRLPDAAEVNLTVDDIARLLNYQDDNNMSSRRREVLLYMSHGLDNNDLAKALGVSPETVKTHVSRILRDMACKNRTHAVAEAIRQGIIE